ncbi:Sugar transporter ERD6 [Raphanus sativus]|nr:Sugar transporter ERD6 [Raphanus sativus]
MMLFCEAFCVTGWLVIALAKDALWLDCGRLLLGIGVGLFSYVIPVYIAEIAPKHVRGSFCVRQSTDAKLRHCALLHHWQSRSMAIIAIVGEKGRDEDCRSALQRLRGPDVDISCEANTIRV